MGDTMATKSSSDVVVLGGSAAKRSGKRASQHVLTFAKVKENTSKDGKVTSAVYHEVVDLPGGGRDVYDEISSNAMAMTDSGNFYLRRAALDRLGWDNGPDALEITIQPRATERK